MKIASIFKKYGKDRILGWGDIDIKNGDSGWFYDGSPESVTYYADSPEWFNQFCGEGFPYWGLISEEKRHGYRNRDYATALESITTLIDSIKMSEEEKKEVIDFFNKCWQKFGNTKPGLILVPYYEVLSDEEKEFISMRDTDPNLERLFMDIISCSVTENNQCCKKNISPEKLLAIDLSCILPKYTIKRDQENEITLSDCIRLLKGFDLTQLKKAHAFLNSLEDQTKEGS